MAKEPDDFVGIIGGLANFVQNERTTAYNEAVDMMLGNVRDWMRDNGIRPTEQYLPELLDEIKAHFVPPQPADHQ